MRFYFAFPSRPSYNRLGIIITGLAFDSSQRYFRIIDVTDGSDWNVKERGKRGYVMKGTCQIMDSGGHSSEL